ncbi:MAG: M48 family metalloprotease, partial [Rhodanobacteraceae bacterium]
VAGVVFFTLLGTFVDPFAIAPPFARQADVPAATASAIESLARQAGSNNIRLREIELSTRVRAASSYVAGLGPSQEIVLPDTLLAGATPGEIRIVAARGIGHVVAGDPLHLAIAQALVLIFGAALAVFIADRIGFRRDDDPVSRLALVGALLGCVYVVALPLYAGYERRLQARADRYALALTHDPGSAVRDVVRHADQELEPVCPNRFSLWYFGTAPPPAARIAAAQGRADSCP